LACFCLWPCGLFFTFLASLYWQWGQDDSATLLAFADEVSSWLTRYFCSSHRKVNVWCSTD
jgi:hypothetical protein